VGDAGQDIRGEAVGEEALRRLRRESPASQIEERVGIQGAAGGAMGALHVVGVNLELRLAVGARVTREEQVVVGLLGVGPLCAGAYDDAAVEHAASVAV